MKIGEIVSESSLNSLSPAKKKGSEGAAGSAASFGTVISGMIQEVNANQQAADRAIQSLATGESKNLHEVMIAVEKSSVSFQFLAQVRSKVVEAYQEIMRMPV
jgi:flagellar hook-basal body complex protein FliE